MLVKHIESHGKMQDIEIAMRRVKKLKPQGLSARLSKGIDSLGYYKT
jgi:hypothetical protein